MDLNIIEGSVRLSELVSVARIPIHVSIRVRGATIREEMHNLVNSLLVGGEVVPEHCSIFQIGLWVSLLGMNEQRELGRVTEEENRRVVVDPVPITFIGVKLHGEASRVSCTVRRTLLATNS